MVRRLFLAFAAVVLVSTASDASERRVALVLGNADYGTLPALKNPRNDARAISETLRAAGFDVRLVTDLTREGFETEFRRFVSDMEKADVSLVYYSGHGFQVGGENFLVPVDATLEEPADLEVQAIRLEYVLDYMRTGSKVQIVVLDACRNSPFPRDNYWVGNRMASPGGGLAQVQGTLNTLIAFSTSPGAIAGDGLGDLSPFSGAFAAHALTPNAEIRAVMAAVRREVVENTGGQQVPWENSSLVEDVYLVRRDSRPVLPDLVEKTVVAGQGPVMLGLPEPVQSDGGTIVVSIDRPPELGRLLVDGDEVEDGESIPGPALPRLAFDVPDDVAPGKDIDMLAYSARNDWGGEARGIVAFRIKDEDDPDATALVASLNEEERVVGMARTAAVESVAGALSGLKIEVPVGIGPVPLGMTVPEQRGAAVRAVRVAGYPENGALSLPGRTVVAGSMLEPAEVALLRFEPRVGASDPGIVEFEVRADGGEASRAKATLQPVVDACDEAAAEPLDIQGVTAGRLPNEIGPEALDACRKAVEAHPGVPRFRYQHGRALLASGEVEAAMQAFAKAAYDGHVRAMFQLGYMHATGTGTAVDRNTANAFYKAASDLGDPYGMTSWGRALFAGNGVEADPEQGLDLLIKAAAMGHTYPMNDLASIFIEGQNGVPADTARAIAYLDAGVQRRDMYSMNRLARMYLLGNGVEQDDAAARRLFEEAIDLGQPYAPTNLGRMYRDGVGVKADRAKAAELFELSARRGDPFGAFDRAALEIDRGDAGDRVVAARYFATAAAVDFRGELSDARPNLAALDRSVRERALEALKAEAEAEVALSGDLDEDLIALARQVWEEANPRRDLF